MLCKNCKGAGVDPSHGGMCAPCFGWGKQGGTSDVPPVLSEAEAVEILRGAELNIECSGVGEVRPAKAKKKAK